MAGVYPDGNSPVRLHDGTTASLRLLHPNDFDSVVELFEGLDDRDRYRRFFTVHPRHVLEWVASVTNPPTDAVALGAFDHGELVGVANYAPTTVPGRAEVENRDMVEVMNDAHAPIAMHRDGFLFDVDVDLDVLRAGSTTTEPTTSSPAEGSPRR